MLGGTLNFRPFNMVPKMENSFRLFVHYDYFMSVRVLVTIQLEQE